MHGNNWYKGGADRNGEACCGSIRIDTCTAAVHFYKHNVAGTRGNSNMVGRTHRNTIYAPYIRRTGTAAYRIGSIGDTRSRANSGRRVR